MIEELEIKFGSSPRFSLGIEEEFQILNPRDFELVSRADSIIHDTPAKFSANVKYELIQSILEVNTKICRDINEAARDLMDKRCLVFNLARNEGLLLASAGTHPFSRWQDQRITPNPRYLRIVSDLQWVARRELIFGLHVHVGVDDKEKVIAIVNAFRKYLPYLLALSANSPFWSGMPTKLQSTRIKLWDVFPRSGIPQVFENWEAYRMLLDEFKSIGSVEGPRDFWWDVRPHPDFGTVEIRICDAQTEPEESLAIAALIQAMVAWFSDRFEAGEKLDAQRRIEVMENKWRASRYGLNATLIDFDTLEEIPARVAVELLLKELSPYFDDLNSGDYLEKINSMLIAGNGAQKQMEIYQETEDLNSVLADIVWRTYNIENHEVCEKRGK